MNIYVVIEGELGAKKVYTKWIPLTNPLLTPVTNITEVARNNFIIYSGKGCPNYYEVIELALKDVAVITNTDGSKLFNRLVIGVDSEEKTFEQKYVEIETFIQKNLKKYDVTIDYRIVIQHFCFETWALGNQRIVSRKPKNHALKKYLNHFNVAKLDPEDLIVHPDYYGNRAQFSDKFLQLLINEKNKKLTYKKNDPVMLLHDKYFDEIKKRHIKTNHLQSFKGFLEAFR